MGASLLNAGMKLATPGESSCRAMACGPLQSFALCRCPMCAEVGAGAGRRGALLRSCLGTEPQACARHKQSTGLFVSGRTPPASACGRRLLLYFAAQSAPPACSEAAVVFDDGRPPLCPAKGVGWPTERSKGGGGGRRPTPGECARTQTVLWTVCAWRTPGAPSPDMSGAERPAGLLPLRPLHTSDNGGERTTAVGRQRTPAAPERCMRRRSRDAQRSN